MPPLAPADTSIPGFKIHRDAMGRIAQRTRLFSSPLETRRYAYDSAGRLARVTDGNGALCESYVYDQQGRRLADICPQSRRGERRYSYGPGNRLGQAGRAQYGHDRAGFRNLKVEAGRETHYEYEPGGLLMGVSLPNGRRLDYAYDAKGQRTAKFIDGQVRGQYVWLDPLRLAAFHDGRQWWRLAYTNERSPVGVTNGRDSYLILTDQVGTPVALATIDGTVVQTMRYDSFGNPLRGLQGPVRLPLGFAGGLFDADTGLTRFVWRDYDADTGRFTALDPLREKGGDSDWYGYCVDDPVNRVDARGLKPYYCWWTDCDDNGTIQGDYQPIEGKKDELPFLLDFSVPIPKSITNALGIGDKNDTKEMRLPLLPDIEIGPFKSYYEEQNGGSE